MELPHFLCGPGDPEGFLYRGTRNADGTRDGDQMALIGKLAPTGANCIYMIAVRSHGGDGGPTENPFVDSDPAQGLDARILGQWETWFAEMDRRGIVTFLILYDDSACVWDTGDRVGPAERGFIRGLVDRFRHHRNLVWCIAEEYQEAYTAARVRAIAAEVRAADGREHPITVHKLHGLDFVEFADDPNIDQFAVQYNVPTAEELHGGCVQARKEAAGRYGVILSEAADWGTGEVARRKAWACAMGGASVMVLGMDIATTPVADLENCGRLARFMESADYARLEPHDELGCAGTEYVLAAPGKRYIAYASALDGPMGLRDLPPGGYELTWLDCATGQTVSETMQGGGDREFAKPESLGSEVAVLVTAGQGVVELQGDVRITEPTTWADAHYVVHGNVVLARGGALTVENATVELANRYAREFRFVWEGGKLITRRATIGGTMHDGTAQCSNIEVLDGEWEATDTTVRYCYGVIVGGYATPGKLRATRLAAGPNPDSIIMGGQGDAIVTDSSYAISLNVFANAGGGGEVLNLPVNTPVSAVYDARMLPGATYRLELVNTTVSLWFLFANGVTNDGPPAEIVLGDCPFLIPSVMCTDLKGEVHLPCPWGREPNASLKVGNLTWRTADRPVNVFTWGVYLSGAGTDVTLLGPTLICELMVFAGTARLIGSDGTYDAATTATTIEVGSDAAPETPARLEIRNAAIGRFAENDTIRGQITAHGRGEIVIEHARCAPLTLITKGQGTICLANIEQRGPIEEIEEGGRITAPQ